MRLDGIGLDSSKHIVGHSFTRVPPRAHMHTPATPAHAHPRSPSPHTHAGTKTLLRAAYLRAAGEEEEESPASLEGVPAPSLADQLADDMLENAINVVDKGCVLVCGKGEVVVVGG